MKAHWVAAVAVAILAVLLGAVGAGLIAAGGVGETPGVGALLMNVVVAGVFPVVAVPIAQRRPGHLLAWLYSTAGLGGAVTLFAYGYAQHGLELAPGSLSGAVSAGWVSSWVWATGVVPLVTLGLLLFPDGKLPSRRWRTVALAAIMAAVLLAAAQALRPGPLLNHPSAVNPLGVRGAAPLLDLLGGMGFGLFVAAFLAAAASVYLRWRRGNERERRQLRWLLYAAAVLLLGVAVDTAAPSPTTSLLAAGTLAFFPVAVGIAITREHLYDIDLLINRSLVYGVLTAGVIATYVVVVAAVGGLLGRGSGPIGPLVATGLVAVAFQPAHALLQRHIARLVYGEHADPYASLATLGRRLESALEPHAVLPVVVETVATALQLPYVAIELDEGGTFRRAASSGTPTAEETVLLLIHQGRTIGRLVLGRRHSGEMLGARERRLLEDLARQAGIAVQAVRLTAALQRSREDLVVAREAERRRLHRELHDGLGPALAAMALQFDVLQREIPDEAHAARRLAGQLKEIVQSTIPEIRALIEGLRPPALDEVAVLALVTAVTKATAGTLLSATERLADCSTEVTLPDPRKVVRLSFPAV